MRSNFAKARRNFGLHDKVQMKPRHKFLRSIEGTYKIEALNYTGSDTRLYEFLCMYWWDAKTKNTPYSKFGAKLTRYVTHPKAQELLLKQGYAECDYSHHYHEGPYCEGGYFSPNDPWTIQRPASYMYVLNTDIIRERIVEILKRIVPIEYKITCRINDIMRMSNTKHFTSCVRFPRVNQDQNDEGTNSAQISRDLNNPDMCLIMITDKGGDIKSRTICRLLRNDKHELVLGVQDVYGNGPDYNLIYRDISKRFNIKIYSLNGNYIDDKLWQVSTLRGRYKRVYYNDVPLVGCYSLTKDKKTFTNGIPGDIRYVYRGRLISDTINN